MDGIKDILDGREFYHKTTMAILKNQIDDLKKEVDNYKGLLDLERTTWKEKEEYFELIIEDQEKLIVRCNELLKKSAADFQELCCDLDKS